MSISFPKGHYTFCLALPAGGENTIKNVKLCVFHGPQEMKWKVRLLN